MSAGENGTSPQLGRYVLGDRLGAGGLGIVYRATDPALGREVAVKLVNTVTNSEKDHARLIREARSLAQLSHPNVVQLFDVGTYDEDAGLGDPGVFIVMELVDGVTLDTYVATKRPRWRRVVDLLVAAGRGLAAAHRRSLIHRDFKPNNVIVDRHRRVRVLDFGLARPAVEDTPTLPQGAEAEAAADARLTATGMLMGTPAYMAPEQLDGQPLDERADQFSFCVSLWELLFSARPFESNTMLERATLMRGGPPDAPPSSPVPAEVVATLHRGLAYERGARFPTMSDLLADLERARGRRGMVLPAVIGGAAAVAAVAAGVGLIRPPPEPSQTVAAATTTPDLQRDRATFAAEVAAAEWLPGVDGYTRGVETLERLHTEARDRADPVMLAASSTALATKALYRRDTQEATRLAEEALALANDAGRDDLAFDATFVLGSLALNLNRFEACERHIRSAEALLVRLPSDLGRRGRLALLRGIRASRVGPPGDALALGKQAARMLADAGEPAVRQGIALRVAAAGQGMKGDDEAAIATCTEALTLVTQTLGADHPDVARGLMCRAGALSRLRRHVEAEADLLQAVAILRRRSRPVTLAAALADLARATSALGRQQDALTLHEEALEAIGDPKPEDVEQVAGMLNNYAGELAAHDDLDGAIEAFARALTILEETYGTEAIEVATVRANYGIALEEAGSPDQARRELLRVLPSLRGAGRHSAVLSALADLELGAGRVEQAWTHAEELRTLPDAAFRSADDRAEALLRVAEVARRNAALPTAERLAAATSARVALIAAGSTSAPALQKDPGAWVNADVGEG